MTGSVDPPRPGRSNRFRRGVFGVGPGIIQDLARTRLLLLVLAVTGALLRPSIVVAAVSSGSPNQDWVRQIGPASPADPIVESPIVPSPALDAFSIRADPGFIPALEQLLALQHTWTLQALAVTGTRLEWVIMAPDAAGSFRPDLGAIRFNARWYKSDSRALAALVEHEAKHVADALAGLDIASPAACVLTEVNAYREEAKTWGEMVGTAGKSDPRDDLERSLNRKLSIYQGQPDTIPALITSNLGYQTQCKLR
jgi:hypothetical protein